MYKSHQRENNTTYSCIHKNNNSHVFTLYTISYGTSERDKHSASYGIPIIHINDKRSVKDDNIISL